MSEITSKFYIEQLYVKQYEGLPNSVARVRWACVLKRGAGKLLLMGETDLAAPNPEAFINIGALEAQQVLDWVVETEGGQSWLNSLIAIHEDQMQKAEADAVFEPWHIPLINPRKFDPANV